MELLPSLVVSELPLDFLLLLDFLQPLDPLVLRLDLRLQLSQSLLLESRFALELHGVWLVRRRQVYGKVPVG